MSPTQSPRQDLCIKWNSYLGNLGSAFPKLLADQRFLDVTLSCEGQQLRCHKVVLAACSPYLETLLNENPCKHPIIVMPQDIKMWEMQALVDFMYKGEVNVSHAGLADFVKCAELLQIRGLWGSEEDFNLNLPTPTTQITTARSNSSESASSFAASSSAASSSATSAEGKGASSKRKDKSGTAAGPPIQRNTSSIDSCTTSQCMQTIQQQPPQQQEQQQGEQQQQEQQQQEQQQQEQQQQEQQQQEQQQQQYQQQQQQQLQQLQRQRQQQLLPFRANNPKLELFEESCDEDAMEGEKGAEHLVEILCDVPNETHYTDVTQTSIIEHVEELDDSYGHVNGQTNNSGYSDLDFDYIEQDSCRDSLNDIVSELTMKEQDSKGDYSRLSLRRRPISEEKSDSDGATSGYSSLQILDVRSLANNTRSTSSLKACLRPSSEDSEDNPDLRVMLSTSLTRAIKKNVMNNRSYAIFRKTVRRHSTFGTRKKKNANNRRGDRCISPSAVVLPPPKQNKPREYDAKAMYTALMEVRAGSGITEASARHKIPRTTLCNWLKRLNIAYTTTPRQKHAESK